jgi:hypothetical protein
MNKFQRAGAGIYGAIENALDDLRHTWEKSWFGNEITGDVNMFQPQGQEQTTAELFDQLYSSSNEPPDYGQDISIEPDMER